MFHPQGPTFAELMQQALSSTRHGYDLLAPKFDLTPFRTPDWLLAAVAPLLGGPGSVGRALDLCCGTGAGVAMLWPLCRELVAGCDFSLGMLAEARRRLAPPGSAARLILFQQDVLLPGLRAAFDLVTTFGALGHIRPREQRRFLAGAAGCLAPGGRLAFVTAPHPPPWSPALWLAAGFDAVMALRNLLWRPKFVMYYLSWPLARTLRLLAETGLVAEALPLPLPGAPGRLRLVVARRG